MTNTVSRELVLEALGRLVREALVRGETVELPGLGTFRVEHQPSRTDQLPDGSIALRPPSDNVVFVPES